MTSDESHPAAPATRDFWRLLPLYLYVFVEFGKPEFLAPLRPGLLLQAGFLLLIFAKLRRSLWVLRQPYFVLLLLLLALMTLHVLIATNNYLAFMVWRQMLSYLIFGVAYSLLLDTVARVELFIFGFVLVLATISAITLLGLAGPLGGTMLMGDTNDWNLATNTMAPIAFVLGISRRGARRAACLVAVCVFLATSVASLSRGGFVGMAMVGAMCLWQVRRRMHLVLLVAIAAAVLFGTLPETYKAEVQSIWQEGGETGTGRDRIELWKVGLRMFREHPLLGVGQGNLSLRLGEFQYGSDGSSHWGRNISGRTVHSVLVQVLAELGMLGTILIVALVLHADRQARAVIRRSEERCRDAGVGAVSREATVGLRIGAFGYLITAMFLSALYYPYLWNLLSLINARALARSRPQDPLPLDYNDTAPGPLHERGAPLGAGSS